MGGGGAHPLQAGTLGRGSREAQHTLCLGKLWMVWSRALNKRLSTECRGHMDLELGPGPLEASAGRQAGSHLGLVAEGMLKVGGQEEVVF